MKFLLCFLHWFQCSSFCLKDKAKHVNLWCYGFINGDGPRVFVVVCVCVQVLVAMLLSCCVVHKRPNESKRSLKMGNEYIDFQVDGCRWLGILAWLLSIMYTVHHHRRHESCGDPLILHYPPTHPSIQFYFSFHSSIHNNIIMYLFVHNQMVNQFYSFFSYEVNRQTLALLTTLIFLSLICLSVSIYFYEHG